MHCRSKLWMSLLALVVFVAVSACDLRKSKTERSDNQAATKVSAKLDSPDPTPTPTPEPIQASVEILRVMGFGAGSTCQSDNVAATAAGVDIAIVLPSVGFSEYGGGESLKIAKNHCRIVSKVSIGPVSYPYYINSVQEVLMGGDVKSPNIVAYRSSLLRMRLMDDGPFSFRIDTLKRFLKTTEDIMEALYTDPVSNDSSTNWKWRIYQLPVNKAREFEVDLDVNLVAKFKNASADQVAMLNVDNIDLKLDIVASEPPQSQETQNLSH